MKKEIRYININKLIPYEFNNKIHPEEQINKIANSIKEFGFNQPIVIDKNNIIVVGHGRYEAAKKLGLENVPVIQVDNLTETQIKKYRLLDNKLAELAIDNIENIQIELESLGDTELNELYDLDLDVDFDNIKDNEDRGVSDKTRLVECPNCGEKFNI